jgi:hypothetical protein
MRRSFKNRKAATALGLVSLFSMAAWMPAYLPAQPVALSGSVFPEIILQANDTIVSPFDTLYKLTVYLTNIFESVSGIEITLVADRSGLLHLPDSTRVDTTILCVDTMDCDPADTTIDTVSVSPIDLAGSAISYWQFLQARATTPTTFRFVGLADYPGGSSPPPLPPATSGAYLLFSIILEREVTVEVLDTLQDRTVNWLISQPTSFSDPNGNSIGLQESTYCVDPPVCDTIDTVRYYDPAINVYVNGAVTFAPNCLIGDVNGSGSINSSDVIYLVAYVFKAGPEPVCTDGKSGDVNCSGSVTAADVIYLVNFVFKGGPAPCSE